MESNYTSEQYKYLLFQRLRRHIFMSQEADRYYTQSFFAALFDGIVITTEAYNNFVSIMEDQLEYCAENGIYACENITSSDINDRGVFLIEAFAKIGITLEIKETTDGSDGRDAFFTKPDGEVLIYKVRSGTNYFYINSKAQMDYDYAKLSYPYYTFTDSLPIELEDWHPRRCGKDTYWSYEPDTNSVEIHGNGSLVSIPSEEQLGSGEFTTVIIGSEVKQLKAKVFNYAPVIVFFHSPEDEIECDPLIFGSATISSSYECDIYCNNPLIKSAISSQCVSIKYHNLEDWEGVKLVTPSMLEYNGITLPFFSQRSASNTRNFITLAYKDSVGYRIFISSAPLTYKDGMFANPGSSNYWNLSEKQTYWKYGGQTLTSATEVTWTPIWTNYNMKDSSGTIMLESTPPKRNGISMSATRYIYHKAGPLALIPEVGTLTYPYAYIVKTDDAIELYFTTNAITTSSSTSSTSNAYFVFRGNAKKYSYLEDANTWLYLGEENVQGATRLISNLMWANDKVSYSIVNQNGSTSTYTAVSAHQTTPLPYYE